MLCGRARVKQRLDTILHPLEAWGLSNAPTGHVPPECGRGLLMGTRVSSHRHLQGGCASRIIVSLDACSSWTLSMSGRFRFARIASGSGVPLGKFVVSYWTVTLIGASSSSQDSTKPLPPRESQPFDSNCEGSGGSACRSRTPSLRRVRDPSHGT